MERLGRSERKGLGRRQLLFWGLLFLLAGMFSRSFLQNRILQMDKLTGQQLLEVMSASGTAMAAATAAIVMQAVETCAIPIFAFLLVEGFEKMRSRKKLALSLLITAAVSEIPYNFAMHGKLLYMTSRNPVVALVIGIAVLYFFRRCQGNSFQNVLVKLFVGIASVLWAVMLNIDHGVALLVMIMVMWALRGKKPLRALFGAVVAAACALISPLYVVSSMGMLPVHLYREDSEQAQETVAVYAAYPILLGIVGALANLI